MNPFDDKRFKHAKPRYEVAKTASIVLLVWVFGGPFAGASLVAAVNTQPPKEASSKESQVTISPRSLAFVCCVIGVIACTTPVASRLKTLDLPEPDQRVLFLSAAATPTLALLGSMVLSLWTVWFLSLLLTAAQGLWIFYFLGDRPLIREEVVYAIACEEQGIKDHTAALEQARADLEAFDAGVKASPKPTPGVAKGEPKPNPSPLEREYQEQVSQIVNSGRDPTVIVGELQHLADEYKRRGGVAA